MNGLEDFIELCQEVEIRPPSTSTFCVDLSRAAAVAMAFCLWQVINMYTLEEAITTNEPLPNVSFSSVLLKKESKIQEITTEEDVAKPFRILSEYLTTKDTAYSS